MIRGPNVKTNFLENFVESWIFMYMMDNNKITPKMVSKFIDGMYNDTHPGFIKDYNVEVINYDNKKYYNRYPDVIIHILIDNEVYSQLINDRIGSGISTGEIIIDMENKLKSILKYLPYPANIKFVRYNDDIKYRSQVFNLDSDRGDVIMDFNYVGLGVWNDKTNKL
jgi:hypothetical protein